MTWDEVQALLLVRWPAHKWEDLRLQGYMAELMADLRSPERGALGLRTVVSNGFVPSVDQVREAARVAQGPPTSAQIAAATAKHLAKGSQRHLKVA